MTINEDIVEQACLEWLSSVGYEVVHGGIIEPEGENPERDNFDAVLLLGRLRLALERINHHIPASARQTVIDDVIRQVQRRSSQSLTQNNREFHRLLTDGVDVSFKVAGGIKHDKVFLIDVANPLSNAFLAVNQFTVTGIHEKRRNRTNRRPDIVLFVNGIPLVVIELKNIASEQTDIKKAYQQLQTYKDDIPELFVYNALLVISDGTQARVGGLTSGLEHFKAWRTIDGIKLDPTGLQLETVVRGVFAPDYLLDLVRYFVLFEMDNGDWSKKVASYHQYHAVNKAVERSVEATHATGNRKVGVVWHTQGSGKSLTMLFYAGKIIQHPELKNPTVIVLTDRNELDDQLYAQFSAGRDLLRQNPVQAESRDNLRELLSVASGGVVFTTIQKFTAQDVNEYPLLSERRNIIFIADEAHRSQYGFSARLVKQDNEAKITYGFAKYLRDGLPNASFIGFTGTPIEQKDANTRDVFGDYIDIYDIRRAVDDKATVPIYYESRLAQLKLRDDVRPNLDEEFEEITELEEDDVKETLKSRWAQLEAMVGTPERLTRVAEDIIQHFEQRLEALDGKGMIVCMSRRIAVDLYNTIIALRPSWHSDEDEGGFIKVVMTGNASDPQAYQPHVRSKERRTSIAKRFKDPENSLKLVIVRDMWLTGFDVRSLHTMYVDKPMQGHGLMQAIARVNRVFKDKAGGLIVDYLGIAVPLKEAMNEYIKSGSGELIQYQEKALALLETQYGVVDALFKHFDYSVFFNGTPVQRLEVIPQAMEHILTLEDGKKRYMRQVKKLSDIYALCVPHEKALAIREHVAFFQAVRANFVKFTTNDEARQSDGDVDGAVRQLVSKAVVSDKVVNLFDTLGFKSPDVSVLSDTFLEEVSMLPQKNVVIELLRRLIDDEIRINLSKNVVKGRSFAKMLEETINRYQNRAIDAVEVISELIGVAKEIQASRNLGESLNLNDDEIAFYDALAMNESAMRVMQDRQLAVIATELVKSVRANVTVDWSIRESARAKIRVLVKRILKNHGYPPDLQDEAVKLVLEQAEQLAKDWMG